jgi:N-formylglutamate amidohydrolase
VTARRWTVITGDDPVVATAIHAGHSLRPEALELTKLSEAHRLREEDPFTDQWVGVARNSIAVDVSRFEVDLNRPREKAVYVKPEDAWGLDLWTSEPSADMVERSLGIYDLFYAELGEVCDRVIDAYGHVVVLDLHSYNHRRNGADASVDDPELNPEINLGTESIAASWAPVVSAFTKTMGELPFYDDTLDVRTNVKFKGGHMARWLNARYQDKGCSIAVEMKKIFMDEWSGALDEGIAASIGSILGSAAESVRLELRAR